MNIIFKDEAYDRAGVMRRALVHHKGEFYIASENTALDETLIFSSSPTGEIASWSEVGGGKCVTLEEVLADFDNMLYSRDWSYDDDTEDI